MARILTGIQATGIPHLGNILGAIRPAIEMANNPNNDAFLFIADLHSLTTIRDANILKENTYGVAAAWLALGLDPDRAVFYRQSDVPEVTELTWYLSCFAPYPMLANAHSFKDKSNRLADVNAGLFVYPVLMSADIILYDADYVPVGKDQWQHIEITRDIATIFNRQYGETFIVPDGIILMRTGVLHKISDFVVRVAKGGTANVGKLRLSGNQKALVEEGGTLNADNIREDQIVRIRELVIPGTDGEKMSKSYNNTINIFLPDGDLRKVIMKIITDATPVEQPKNPDTCNVFKLYSLVAEKDEIEEMRQNYLRGGYGYGQAKETLYQTLRKKFSVERQHYDYYIGNKERLDKILKTGAEKAKDVAQVTLKKVREKLGYKSAQ